MGKAKNSFHDPEALFAGIRLVLETAAEPSLLVDGLGDVLWLNSCARAQCATLPARLADLGETTGEQVTIALRKALRTSTPVYARLFLRPGVPGVYQARRLELGDGGGDGGGLALFQGDGSKSLLRRFIAVRSAADISRDRLRRIQAEKDELRREAARLRNMVRIDALTGLLNPSGFSEEVGRLLADGHTLRGTMLYLDLDNFKPVNDRFGHAAGDAVLRATAMRLKAEVRQGDLVGRMGGDEFAVWLSGAPRSEVRNLSLRIKAAVSAPLRIAEQRVPVTDLSVALGTATWPQEAEDVSGLLELADARMYEDKNAARHRMIGLRVLAGAGGAAKALRSS